MVNNYWKIATRNLLAQKWYSAINIFGLAIGISCTFLISLYVLDELRYDRFHEKSDLIYRIGTGIKQENGSEVRTAAIPAMWAPTLTEELPNVASFVRFYKYRSDILMSNEQTESKFYEGNFFWCDSTVFDVFTFPLISGRPNAALEAPNSIVISESAARKYFGEEAPIGKSLRYVNQNVVFDLEVTGVMQDVPHTSHFRPDFLASLSTFKPGTWLWKYDLPTSWTNLFYQSYVVLSPQTDYKKIETELSALLERHIGEEGAAFRPFLQPLTSIHLHSNLSAEFEVNSDVKYLYIFSFIAFLILLVACINYMNLATARAQRRKKEVGLRKTLGGFRSQLLWQFYAESFLVSLLSVLVAVSIVWGVLPFFNTLTSKSFSLSDIVNKMNLGYLLIFTVFVSVLSGSYPALFLSRFAPVTALKESHKSDVSGAPSFLRKGLVVFQFGVTVVLLIVTQFIDRQVNFLSESRLRVDGDQIVNVPLRGKDVHESFAAFKNEILRNPAITGVTTSSHIPFTANKSGSYKLPGILGVTAVFESDYFVVDSDFARVFELQFITGRDFSIESAGDSREFLLNERAVKMLGVDPANVVGKQIEDPDWSASGKIVGVVENFHYRSLHSAIGPLVMKMDPAYVRFMSIRVEPYAIKEALDMLAREWKAFFPSSPFVFSFMDDDFNRMYRAEGKMASLFRYFSAIAVLISCFGLLALASFMVEQRTKEIGVRKVLGASVTQIVGLLSREFLRLVIVAFIIASPVALWAAHRWLQDFTYRVAIQPKPFVLTGILVFALTWFVVGYQSFKAARNNPVTSLRDE